MIEKNMVDLKNELSFIVADFKAISNYEYGRCGTFIGFTYRVILKTGIEFYISIDSYKLPEFNFDDIVYINKRLLCDSENGFEKHIDTEIGEYCVNSGNYDILIYKLFDVKDTFETGCFE